jgi:hypothetical protein
MDRLKLLRILERTLGAIAILIALYGIYTTIK